MFVPEIIYKNANGYLHAIVKGKKTDFETALRYWSKILIECSNRNYTRLLVEREFPRQLDILEINAIARHVASVSSKLNIQLAFVDKKILVPGIYENVKSVAQKLGAKAVVFDTLNEAKSWLQN